MEGLLRFPQYLPLPLGSPLGPAGHWTQGAYSKHWAPGLCSHLGSAQPPSKHSHTLRHQRAGYTQGAFTILHSNSNLGACLPWGTAPLQLPSSLVLPRHAPTQVSAPLLPSPRPYRGQARWAGPGDLCPGCGPLGGPRPPKGRPPPALCAASSRPQAPPCSSPRSGAQQRPPGPAWPRAGSARPVAGAPASDPGALSSWSLGDRRPGTARGSGTPGWLCPGSAGTGPGA